MVYGNAYTNNALWQQKSGDSDHNSELKKLEHHINTLVLLWNKGKITET